jgi:sensor domain CHASE-containing protein
MPLIIAILVTLMVIVLTRAFVMNAITLKRDIDRRFSELQVRLESEANSTLDALLERNAEEDRGQ